jgi:hypothetical protein
MPFIVYSQLISNWQANKLSQSAGLIIISHLAQIYPQLIADWLAYYTAWLYKRLKNTSIITINIRVIFKLPNILSVYYKPGYIIIEAI